MLKRLSSKALMLFMSLILLACTSGKIVKTYEGKVLPQAEVAVLTASENISIQSVNGVEVQQYLLSNLEVNYGLKAGENLIVFQYESIWSKAKKDEETGSRVDVVKSKPLEVRIVAKPGAKYTFSFMPASNVREAKQLASSFEAQIVDEQKNLVAESVALNTHKKEQEQLMAKEQSLLLEARVAKSQALGTDKMLVIDQLKAIWPSASAEEKKAFLVWVFQ